MATARAGLRLGEQMVPPRLIDFGTGKPHCPWPSTADLLTDFVPDT